LRLTNALFVFDEVFTFRPMRSRRRAYFNLDRRTRVLSSILNRPDTRPDVATEPPPTFPFLESQCQRANPDVNFNHARAATPPARQCPASGVGGVYRRGSLPCQTPNGGFPHFICGPFARVVAGLFAVQPIWAKPQVAQ
jgi:hypothetical protein